MGNNCCGDELKGEADARSLSDTIQKENRIRPLGNIPSEKEAPAPGHFPAPHINSTRESSAISAIDVKKKREEPLLNYADKLNEIDPKVKSKFHELHAYKLRKDDVSAKPQKLIYINDHDTYQGDVEASLPNGFGLVIYQDGSLAEGEFENGKPKDVRRIFVDGTVYEGEYLNDHFDGKGKYFGSEGYSVECDNWKQGVLNGLVKQRDKDGTILGEVMMKDDKKEGVGYWFDHSANTSVKGTFRNDLLEGYGEKETRNGLKYKGEFKEGIAEGHGTIVFIDGRSFEGEFVKGKIEGEGIFTSDEGKKSVQVWANGRRKNAN